AFRYRVAPPVKLIALNRPGQRRDGAESDEDRPGDVALHLREADAAAEPLTERAGDEGPGAVAEEPEEREEQAERQDLRPGRAARGLDELRQEGEEEERSLGVEHVDDDALAVEPAHVALAAVAELCRPLQACEAPDPDHDQVG